MKKLNIILWYLPICFFIFLASFLFIKFIFIFFFNAAFEPEFMFDLTPYYLFTGVNNLHLLLLSLIVVGFNAYLHFKIIKKNLIISFFPTGILLAGLGLKIATQEMSIFYILHYLLFGFLLIIALVDQRHVLVFPEIIIPSGKEKFVEKIAKPKQILSKTKAHTFVEPQYLQTHEIDKTSNYVSAYEIFELHKETLSDLRSILKDDLRRAKDLLEELEHRTRKIDILEEEIRNRKYNTNLQHTSFTCPYSSFFDKQYYVDIKSIKDESMIELKKEKQILYDNFNVEKFLGCAAIIKRGLLKQVNSSFAKLLGFEKEMLLEKTLFNFVAPEGLFNIEEYYLKRLKGIEKNSYETILLKNNNGKIHVEITIKPTKFYGEIADIAIIRELK